MRRWTAIASILGLLFAADAAPAQEPDAGLKVCNVAERTVGVALGRRGEGGWQTTGWTEIAAGDCALLIDKPLVQSTFYLYATDETGGAWQGDFYLCSRGQDFEIFGTGDCVARGYSRTPFFAVETGEADGWIVWLEGPGASPHTVPAATSWVQSSPEESARHQLYAITTFAEPAAPLPKLLTQSGATIESAEWRQILELVDAWLGGLTAIRVSEVRIWYRDRRAGGARAERLSFYDGAEHLVTVVRTAYGFALGIDPGR